MQENLSNYLQLLCDNAPVGMIITNSNNTILYVNQSARGLLDYDDDSSATLSSCIPTDEIRCSGGKPKSVYFNKKTLSVSVKTAKLEKQLFDLWYIIDISKEEQQADEMHCLKTILDCIDEGVVMSDSENKITLYNKPYAKSEGLSPDQVIGKHLDEVYDTNQHVTVLETGIPLMDGYKRYFTFDGKEQEGMGKTYPVIKDNKVIATFSVVRNVKKIRWLFKMGDFNKLADAVFKGDLAEVVENTKKLLDSGANPLEIVNNGLLAGMDIVAPKFKAGEMFVPEVMMSAKALGEGMKIVQPMLSASDVASVGTIVIGTVAGDLHDIGKNLVVMILKSGGFNVIDLGIDVAPEKFVEAIKEHNPQVVGMSALLTTTMAAMKQTLDAMEEAGVRDQAKVIIGGAPVSQGFADEIGADGYASDAIGAKDLCTKLIKG
jgi:5-methyltetrahydrofolate--homocysteine methyltransferase